MKFRKILVLVIFSLSFVYIAAAQNLPEGYGGIKLGMSVDEVKAALLKNPQFGYRGDRDVSLLPGENRVLIQTEGSLRYPNSYLSECFFQFHNDRLYIITININREKMDYYSIFNQLCLKYGNPLKLSPQKAEWSDDTVMMDLEKPLSVKYTDKKVFDELIDAATVKETEEEVTREKFLDSF